MCKCGFIVGLARALLLGQLASHTVTVTASQKSSSQPDQAIFDVEVSSGTGQGLSDVVAAVSSVGVSAANLIGVAFQSNPPALNPFATPTLEWTFQLPVALSMLKQTTASLGALQQTMAQGGSGLSLSFSAAGLQSSGQQTRSCNFAGLILNAQAEAQQTASAAGSPVGRITGLSGGASNGAGNCSATVTFGLGYSGNPGPHAISITASRTWTPLPDQIMIFISVTSGISVGLDEITGVLTQAGVTGASFSDVYTAYTYDNKGNPNPFLQWYFTLAAPLATLKNAIAQLLSAAAALSQQKLGIGLSFSTGGLETSPQAQPACSQAALIADATAQAQALASAAGVSLGPVTAISGAGGTTQLVLLPTVGGRPGTVGHVPGACSMLVEFQLY